MGSIRKVLMRFRVVEAADGCAEKALAGVSRFPVKELQFAPASTISHR
ncbi:hypothetical protein H9Q13_12945 [Pontibacter sp. JH31]|uniref:Uncharacterized protein n=1 Tax=Pontibacter aquaedesilientis TaxID=2766980 RepID=A0ABR7XII2_9BACT|nr:hypothetical protein [Pontibacter aquaedesilientis]